MILAAAAAEASADTFTGLMDHVGQGFEALGAAILVVGFIWSFVLAAVAVRRSGWTAKTYLVQRQAFGGTLLLGLEVLVAADLVHTAQGSSPAQAQVHCELRERAGEPVEPPPPLEVGCQTRQPPLPVEPPLSLARVPCRVGHAASDTSASPHARVPSCQAASPVWDKRARFGTSRDPGASTKPITPPSTMYAPRAETAGDLTCITPTAPPIPGAVDAAHRRGSRGGAFCRITGGNACRGRVHRDARTRQADGPATAGRGFRRDGPIAQGYPNGVMPPRHARGRIRPSGHEGKDWPHLAAQPGHGSVLAAWSRALWTVRTGGGPDGRAEDRTSEHRRTQSDGPGGPGQGAAVEPCEVAPGRGPRGPGRPAGGAGCHPRAGPGAGAPRPDDGLAVHLLPGRGQDHGGGPGGHAGGRAGRPAVRRRPPVELRRLRLARAQAAVRPERLR